MEQLKSMNLLLLEYSTLLFSLVDGNNFAGPGKLEFSGSRTISFKIRSHFLSYNFFFIYHKIVVFRPKYE